MWPKNYLSLIFALILGVSISCTESSGTIELTSRSSNGLRGVVTFICVQDSTTNYISQVRLIEKTNDKIPSPKPNSSCTKYLSDLMEVEDSCPFPPMSDCDEVDMNAPLPPNVYQERCRWFVIYGPAFCPPKN